MTMEHSTSEIFERIQHDARHRLLFERRPVPNLAIQRDVLRRGQTIDAQHQQIEIERDTIMVFADDAPLENWGHPCRYMLYEPENGHLYRTVEAQFPPYLTKQPESFEPFHEPTVFARPERLWAIDYGFDFHVPIQRRGRWYAILFSGASNNRHTNDLEFLYRTLRSDYGVAADRIYVLNYNGTIDYSGSPHPVGNWPGDGTPYTMPVNAEGTKSDLEAVIDQVAGRLQSQDSLLIHTNNHGGHNGESYLVTYSGANYGVADFAAKLGELPNFECLMVMMEQCFAGGFNAPIIAQSPANRTSVASAAIEANTSIGGANFDPFARDWISAMYRAAPDGSALGTNPDANGDGRITAREAFDYADSVHHPHDTPNYSPSSASAVHCRLGTSGKGWLIPNIYLYLERRWPGPIPEALERIEAILPELREIAKEQAIHFEEAEQKLEERLGEVLGTQNRE